MIGRNIPFVDPSIDSSEAQAVNEVIKSKNLVEGKYADLLKINLKN